MSKIKVRALAAAVAGGAALALPVAARAEETVSISAKFTHDVAGEPTMVQGSSQIGTTLPGVPAPLTEIVIAGPAGLGLNVAHSGMCASAALEAEGPSACPADSVAGSGGDDRGHTS